SLHDALPISRHRDAEPTRPCRRDHLAHGLLSVELPEVAGGDPAQASPPCRLRRPRIRRARQCNGRDGRLLPGESIVTVFLRVLEPSVDEKEDVLLSSIRALRTASADRATFEVSPEAFQKVPGSPFAYWTSETIRSVFVTNAPFEADGRTVKQGLATADDFRFVRAWWEVAEAQCGSRWFPFAKGGSYSPFYADVFLCVNWENDGREVSNFCLPGSDKVASRPQNTHFYFRPGLTWPLRARRFAPSPLPSMSIFS